MSASAQSVAIMGKREREDEGRRHSRLDQETLRYYTEVHETFQGLGDAEEKQLLADNVLGDAAGSESAVATDAQCSRVLEALLPFASTAALTAFTQACVEGDNLGTMCTSGPFGSHVLEKCLAELGRRASRAGDEEFEAIEQALTAVTEAAAASLYEMATSKYGSFVARRLLSVLAGRDVAPAPGKKPQQAQQAGGEDGQQGQQQQAAGEQWQGPRGGGALASKLRTADGADGGTGPAAGTAGGADYPALLDRLAAVVLGDEWVGEEMGRLATDAFAGPFLQALLRACTHNQKLLQRLLLAVLGGSGSKGVESVKMERCHALLQDRNGSHLMEAVFATAPDDYFAKLTTLCFKGHLLNLAQHGTANFAVQAAFASLRKPQQLKRMFEDLRPSFQQLLRSRRSGVLAALLAAAGRLGTQEAEAAAALWTAAGQGGSAAAGGASPVEALLTLDTNTSLASGGRLSTLGCAMLCTLLRLPAAACKQWADAVAALPPGKLQHVAKDPGGCRVLEAYLEGPGAAAKKRRALLASLEGCWGEVAMGGSGSHFVEKCYALADVQGKEAIAGELAAVEARLRTTHRGPVLLQRCHVEAFKKGSDGWQKRVAAADAARKEFEELFGAGEEEEAEADEEEGEDMAGQQEGRQQQQAAADEGEEEEDEQPRKKKKKEGKQRAAEAAGEADAAAAGQQEQAGGSREGKKKEEKGKKRRSDVSAQQEGDGDAGQQGQPAKKRKKQKKEKLHA